MQTKPQSLSGRVTRTFASKAVMACTGIRTQPHAHWMDKSHHCLSRDPRYTDKSSSPEILTLMDAWIVRSLGVMLLFTYLLSLRKQLRGSHMRQALCRVASCANGCKETTQQSVCRMVETLCCVGRDTRCADKSTILEACTIKATIKVKG